MKREKGSITIFSLLSLLLITAALFALLEGTRLQEMNRFAGLQTENALESAFASYNTCLWEQYHLLGVSKENFEKNLKIVINGKVGKGTNLLQMKGAETKIKEEVRLTDATGRVFTRSVAAYMSDNWVYEVAKEIYNQYEAIKYLLEENTIEEEDISAALQEVENVKTTKERSFSGVKESTIDVETLLKEVKSWKEKGILNLLIKDTGTLSDSKPDFSTGVLERELEKGVDCVEEISWQERLLLLQYLMTYMANYQSEKSNRALSYEIEYLLAGKESDIENLKVVAYELLAIREVINFMFLVSDSEKVMQAETAAMVVVGASLNPAIVNVVKMGILTAWALAESVLDVRALLSGKRIPLLKSEDTWTTDLNQIREITNGDYVAKESKWGLSYEDYLMVLLLMTKEEDVAMRAVNEQEATVRKVYGDTSFRMDTLLTEANVEAVYYYEPVFPFLPVIDAEKRWEYKILSEESYGYY